MMDKKNKNKESNDDKNNSQQEQEQDDWEIVPNPDARKKFPFIAKNDLKACCSTTTTTTTTAASADYLTPEQIDRYRSCFLNDDTASVAQNAVAAQSIYDVTLSRALLQTSLSPYFSVNIDRGTMPVTNQMDSGRCWMFATLNLFRFGIRDRLGVDDFEFSEVFLYFYYLLEQANFYLERIMDTADRALDDREVAEFLGYPVDDGGDWGIAVALINKYGLVPKTTYPETESSSNTSALNTMLTDLLRSAAWRIRTLVQQRSSMDSVRDVKYDYVGKVYRILCIHLGTPPTRFDFSWRDDQNGTFFRLNNLTPKDFCRDYVTVPFNDYVSLVQDPRNEYYRRYTTKNSMPIQGNEPLIFLNVPSDEMKSMCYRMLKDGLPVFFACNVGIECNEAHGLWDANLYNVSGLYGGGVSCDDDLSKADRIRFGYPMGTHAMLMTGVDIIGGVDQPRRWRVENSWGEDGGGVDGYYTMNDNWFHQNVFEVVVPKQYLSQAAAQGLLTDLVVLPAWDPMCSNSLRRCRGRQRRRGGGGGK